MSSGSSHSSSPAQKEPKDKGKATASGQPEGSVELRVSVVDGIGQVSKVDWDACAHPPANPQSEKNVVAAADQPESEQNPAPDPPAQDSRPRSVYNPFVSYDFLSALEESKSVGGRTGWHVQHVLAKASDGTLVHAAPGHAHRTFAR